LISFALVLIYSYDHNAMQSLKEEHLVRIRELSKKKNVLPASISAKLYPLKNIKAVIFDVYGTLFTSSAGEIGIMNEKCLSAFRDTCNYLHMPFTPLERSNLIKQYLTHIHHMHAQYKQKGIPYPEVDIRSIWRSVLPAHLSKQKIERIALEYELRSNPVWPMPDVSSCLSTLTKQGVHIGIISNAQFYTPLLFPALLNQELNSIPIHFPLWSYLRKRAKPDPLLFQETIKKFNHAFSIVSHQIAYVGNDMLNDMLPASQIGMKTILFAGDRSSLRLRKDFPQLTGAKTDAVILSLQQIAFLLKNNKM